MRRLVFLLATLVATTAAAATLDEAAPPGANYDKAEFRLWYPDDLARIRAIVLLVPGSNGDGRGQVDEPFWREFATRHHVALVGCRFTDKQHDQMFIEHYVEVSKGTGQALLDTLGRFATRSNHAELATAPLMLWGMSAGGEFNYEFAAWKPERVVAFIVNKGNVYYTALASQAARNVPGMMFIGEKDLEFRNHTIQGLFAINRRAGALWGLAQEPGIGHEVGRSRDFAGMFFEEMMSLRLPDGVAGTTLRPLPDKSGYFGDLKTMTFQAVAESKPPTAPAAWLPTEKLARAWQAIVSGKPFDP
jgi:dienelactone hydrolase